MRNKTQKEKKFFHWKNIFTKTYPKDRINAVHKKDDEKRVKKTFQIKRSSKKTIPKNGSMIVHGKYTKKQKSKIKKTIFQRKFFE